MMYSKQYLFAIREFIQNSLPKSKVAFTPTCTEKVALITYKYTYYTHHTKEYCNNIKYIH